MILDKSFEEPFHQPGRISKNCKNYPTCDVITQHPNGYCDRCDPENLSKPENQLPMGQQSIFAASIEEIEEEGTE